MMSPAEWCKNVTGDIFSTMVSWLKCLVNLLIYGHFLKIPPQTQSNASIWCADGSDDEEDKENLIKVEATPINVSARSGDGDVARVDFVRILVKHET